MAEALASLLQVAHVAIIFGGDWPQFEKQIVARLPPHADISKLLLLPTIGTKLYTFSPKSNEWVRIYADLFTETQKSLILSAFDAALAATGFTSEKIWGERFEDRGTFSALGQKAPLTEKEKWDPGFAKRKVIQADLRKRLLEYVD